MSSPYKSYGVVEGDPKSGLLFVCDHARNTLPEAYGTLGLDEAEFERHIAYDIGVEALTRTMAQRLGAPMVYSCFSRLLIDPNRGVDDPTVVMRLSDGTVVPGNHPISASEIENRIEQFHQPYHTAIKQEIERSLGVETNPIIFSVHSFTPYWKGVARPWEVAMLWDTDPRMAQFMIDGLKRDRNLTVGDNEPYLGALKNDTIYTHATSRGLANGLIEVRQDLISDEAGVVEWADRLTPLLEEANARNDMHNIEHYGSRTDKKFSEVRRNG